MIDVKLMAEFKKSGTFNVIHIASVNVFIHPSSIFSAFYQLAGGSRCSRSLSLQQHSQLFPGQPGSGVQRVLVHTDWSGTPPPFSVSSPRNTLELHSNLSLRLKGPTEEAHRCDLDDIFGCGCVSCVCAVSCAVSEHKDLLGAQTLLSCLLHTCSDNHKQKCLNVYFSLKKLQVSFKVHLKDFGKSVRQD